MRVVSLHDAGARPIAKVRSASRVEFGYKTQLVDNEDGVIVDHHIETGNPPDAPMLAGARRSNGSSDAAGSPPRAVTPDRRYSVYKAPEASRRRRGAPV